MITHAENPGKALQWRKGISTSIIPNAPTAARKIVAIPIKRECIQPQTPKLASKSPIPIRKQNESGVCCAKIEAGMGASAGRLAATVAAKVMPSVTIKKAIDPATARKAAKAAACPRVETGSRTPKNVKANPPRTQLTNPNCR